MLSAFRFARCAVKPHRAAARRTMSIFLGDTSKHVQFRQPDAKKPKLILAYSGGLDTSTQLAYLAHEKGFEVCAYIADLGQADVDSMDAIEEIAEKAKQSGAYAFYCADLRREFVKDYVYRAISANALYEGRYLMGTSVARPCIAKKQVEIAWAEGAEFVSHGSTGKGNDQVRFELCYLGMDPKLQCVTLWREPEYLAKFEGRQDLLDYAEQRGIPVTATKKHSYSEDENIMHISYESGELEDPAFPGVSSGNEYPGLVLKKKTVDIDDAPNVPLGLEIDFEKGQMVAIREYDPKGTLIRSDISRDPLSLYARLNEVGGEHGVGRIDIVENRYVGMKSRGCYETPGGTILMAAHLDLELLTLDREVMRLRDSFALKYAELVYNGFWFSPEMKLLNCMVDHTQKVVDGTVGIQLYKGHVKCRGRSSPKSLFNQDLASMDAAGDFVPQNSTGFIQTLSTRLKASRVRDGTITE